jgi:hypothetical protein
LGQLVREIDKSGNVTFHEYFDGIERTFFNGNIVEEISQLGNSKITKKYTAKGLEQYEVINENGAVKTTYSINSEKVWTSVKKDGRLIEFDRGSNKTAWKLIED